MLVHATQDGCKHTNSVQCPQPTHAAVRLTLPRTLNAVPNQCAGHDAAENWSRQCEVPKTAGVTPGDFTKAIIRSESGIYKITVRLITDGREVEVK